ncbi:PAS domain-containing protein [Mucilaginibacter sp. JRF]|uniref:PAS domain-containing protein n=1 Tax=Mucilaginibacter sp. JRF TaxID=2780088 RepID=UPI00187E4E75|nr:PAS domain-containing protein [Mucilaginibacter sp. JRF]MBE9583495.1 PAS domain-containing protein [Mucilaginibacter sp. JRF]
MNQNKVLGSDALLKVLAQSKDAMAIYSDEQLHIAFANDAMIAIWGKDQTVIGKTFEEAIPEMKGQQFAGLLQKVWRTGESFIAKDSPADIEVDGKVQTFYFDFEYRPILNDEGQTYSLLHTATDVTERLKAWKLVEERERIEQQLNDELAATNEELTAINEEYQSTNEQLQSLNEQHSVTNDELALANEELTALNEEYQSTNEQLYSLNEEYLATNEELVTTNDELKSTYEQLNSAHDELAITEAKARILLEGAPVAVGVVDSGNYNIDTANSRLLELWGTDEKAIGQNLNDILRTDEAKALIQILEHVKLSGESVLGYDTVTGIDYTDQYGFGFHNYVYQPVKNSSGQVISVMIVANDVTDQNTLKKQIEYSEHRLTQMIMTAPVGMTIIKGRNLVVEIANEPMLAIWSRTREQIVGKRLMDAFPELADQPFPQMLKNLFDTGEQLNVPEIEVFISDVEGNLKQVYVNFTYSPLFDPDGSVEAVMVSVIDITEIVDARKKLERNEVQLHDFNSELSAINEEQEAANEELLATNEELAITQSQLKNSNDRLVESESRLLGIFDQAPLGIAVLAGPDHVIEIANSSILKIWGRKEEDVINKPHHIARPELDGQPVYQWLDDVYNTGITKVNNEFRVMLLDGDKLREAYVNSIYQPIRNAGGEITGIIVLLEEITEKMIARQQTMHMQDMLNLAVDAGELGTFYYDPGTNRFSGNDLLKSWFGLQPADEIDLNLATDVIADKDRDRVIKAIQGALSYESGGNYDEEYTIINPVTLMPRIVKAKGKATFNLQRQPISLNGTLQDITERKKDEQRKDDFIGMVSHELKTPLTSVTAYIQMLQMHARKNDDEFTGGALSKASLQIKKMTAMINGFLNVSRLESGKIYIDKQIFDIAKLMDEASEECNATISTHNIIFDPIESVIVEADKDKIGHVLNNLISNAVKYSDPGTTIYVTCTQNNGNVQVSVRDEGMGIKPNDISKLFDRYYRVSGNQMKSISGFGIGLYLCAEIIQHHHGKIWVDSDFGHGSTFYFSIPLQ